MSTKQQISALSTLRAGAGALLPIYPQTFEDVARFARMACIAGMVKPLKTGYGDNVQIEQPVAMEARATMILLQGMELGLPPMMAIQLMDMINGRITAHSEAVPGLLLKHGFTIKQEYTGKEFDDDFTAVCTLTRPDGDFIVSRFSVKDAKDSGLWDPAPTVTKFGKTKPNDSAWHLYPKRMLWARALGFAAKDKGADALKGLMVREEMEDILRADRAIDVTPARSIEHATGVVVDDIPEIPDAAAESVQSDAEPTTDPSATLESLRAALAGQSDEAIRLEIWDAHASEIENLSDADQRRAEAIYEGRA